MNTWINRLTQMNETLDVQSQKKDDTHIELTVDKSDLPTIVKSVKALGGRLITMVGADERELHGSFRLYYVFAFDRTHSFLTVSTDVSEQEASFPSVTPELPAADWYEREVFDLLGLKPVGHPNPAPLVLHNDWSEAAYPLRKDFPLKRQVARGKSNNPRTPLMVYRGEGVNQIPVGPIHAGIIEPGHFRFGVVGDMILHLDAQLFYKHRGLEKRSEGMPLKQALFLAERICGACALSHAVSFAQAVERIAQTTVPPRAVALRTLFLELERLYNHVGDVGNVCAGVGFHFGNSYGTRLKEELMQLNERLAGHRFLRGVIALGGVRFDLNEDDLADLKRTLASIEEEFRQLVDTLLDHAITVERMQTTGCMSLDIADDMEVVGPAARAAGRSIDIRRSHPYLLYDRLKFDMPIHREGDVLARIKVRIDEAFQSFALVRQLTEQLPDGGISAEVGDIPAYEWDLGWVESPRGETVHWLMTGPDQRVYRYRVRSAAYSNWPAVPFAVKGNIVPDFPLINKSFQLCYACCDR